MADFSTDALHVAGEIGSIASSPGTMEERAEALLHALSRVVPYQAAQITLLNQERREPVALAVSGYNDAARAYFTSTAVVEEFELLGIHRPHPLLRLCDLPIPAAEVRGWA